MTKRLKLLLIAIDTKCGAIMVSCQDRPELVIKLATER
jgi:hypothetical protein